MIYAPIQDPEQWRQFLAEPDKQWREGYSAHALAHSWQAARGFPRDVRDVLKTSPALAGVEPLVIFPEHKVPLPGGSRSSQNDVWVLAKAGEDLVSIAVEGKVAETFGPTVEEWSKDASDGKAKRMSFLCETVGLDDPCPGNARYQLLHRTASAIIEAKRFNAKHAVMLVHSFSAVDAGIVDFQFFVEQLGGKCGVNEIVRLHDVNGIALHVGWVRSA